MVQRSGIDTIKYHTDPGYQWESDKLTEDTTNESQEVSPFPAGDHKAHINRRAQNIANTRQNKNIKDPQKKQNPVLWRKHSFIECLYCNINNCL